MPASIEHWQIGSPGLVYRGLGSGMYGVDNTYDVLLQIFEMRSHGEYGHCLSSVQHGDYLMPTSLQSIYDGY